MTMSSDYQIITQSIVDVNITSSVNSFGSRRRFQKDLTIADVKNKMELLTGASAGSMKLFLYNKENKLITELDTDHALLGSYPVEDDMVIHVEDKSMKAGEFEDLSEVEKYEMTEDDYSRRTDSVRAFKERNKLGRFNEESQAQKDEEKNIRLEEERKKIESMKIGDRCEVRVKGQPTRRGTIQYLGETDFKQGLWVGIEYDEPHGKNDGSVNGKRYFQCAQKYGSFLKPLTVEVGDFPQEDLDMSEDEI